MGRVGFHALFLIAARHYFTHVKTLLSKKGGKDIFILERREGREKEERNISVREKHPLVEWGCGEIGTFVHWWWEWKNDVGAVANSMELPQNIENSTTIWSNNPTSGYLPKSIKIGILKRYWHSHVHWAQLRTPKPWPTWLSWLDDELKSKRSPVPLPVRARGSQPIDVSHISVSLRYPLSKK